MQFLGGPLDGREYDGPPIGADRPYLVVELTIRGNQGTPCRRPGLFSLYHFRHDNLHFVETRSRQQLMGGSDPDG